MTRQLSNGKFTTPTITGDATLNVIYEQEGWDAVGSLQASSVKILATAFGVSVTGAQAGESIFVYSEDGMLLQSVRVNGNQTNISLPQDALYVIKVGSQVMKLRC